MTENKEQIETQNEILEELSLDKARQKLKEINPRLDITPFDQWFKLEYDWNKFDEILDIENVLLVWNLTDWILNYYEENHLQTWSEFFVKRTVSDSFDIYIKDNPDWLLESIKSFVRWWDTKVLTQEKLKSKTWVDSWQLYKNHDKLDYYWSQKEFMEKYADFLNFSIETKEVISESKNALEKLKAEILSWTSQKW